MITDMAATYMSGTPRAGDDALDTRWFSPEELAEVRVNPKTRELLAEHFGFGQIGL